MRVLDYLRKMGFPEVETVGDVIEDVEFALPPELARRERRTLA